MLGVKPYDSPSPSLVGLQQVHYCPITPTCPGVQKKPGLRRKHTSHTLRPVTQHTSVSRPQEHEHAMFTEGQEECYVPLLTTPTALEVNSTLVTSCLAQSHERL